MLIAKHFYTQSDDQELFMLTKNNDTNAFEEIYKRHWPTMVDIAHRRLSCREKAEDIVQNIFLDFYIRRTDINIPSSVKAYLFQALKFKISNQYRNDSIRDKYQKDIHLTSLGENNLANYIETKELEIAIEKAIKQLPEKCKNVFILSRRKNWSNKDISHNLKIAVSTVEKHIGKALSILKSQIAFSKN